MHRARRQAERRTGSRGGGTRESGAKREKRAPAEGGGGREKWERRRPRRLPAPFVPSLLPASRSPARPPLPAPSPAPLLLPRAGWNFFPWTEASSGAGGKPGRTGPGDGEGPGRGPPGEGAGPAGSRAGEPACGAGEEAQAGGSLGGGKEDGGDARRKGRGRGAAEAGRGWRGAGGGGASSAGLGADRGDPSLRRGSRGAVSLREGRGMGPGARTPGSLREEAAGGLDFWVLGGGGGWEPRLLNPWRRELGAWIPGSRRKRGQGTPTGLHCAERDGAVEAGYGAGGAWGQDARPSPRGRRRERLRLWRCPWQRKG